MRAAAGALLLPVWRKGLCCGVTTTARGSWTADTADIGGSELGNQGRAQASILKGQAVGSDPAPAAPLSPTGACQEPPGQVGLGWCFVTQHFLSLTPLGRMCHLCLWQIQPWSVRDSALGMLSDPSCSLVLLVGEIIPSMDHWEGG